MKRYFTKSSSILLLVSTLLFMSASVIAQTGTIVEWNFNNTAPPEPDQVADAGVGSNVTKLINTEGGRSIDSYPVGLVGQSIAAANWSKESGSKYWIVEFSTVGFENLKVSSAQRSTNNGPKDFKLRYRIGTGLWIDVPGGLVPPVTTSWGSGGQISQLSLPTDMENQASVSLMWVMYTNIPITGPIVSTSSISEIDEILIEGDISSSAPTVNISSASPVSDFIFPDDNNYELYRLDLDVSNNNANLSSITLTTAGTYQISDFVVNGMKLWFSDDDSFDEGTDELLKAINPVVAGDPLVFDNLSKTLVAGNTGYLFLTGDAANVTQLTKGGMISITSTDFSNIEFFPQQARQGLIQLLGAMCRPWIVRILIRRFLILDFNQQLQVSHQLQNDENSAVQVLEFYIWDQGTCDGLNTIVTNIHLEPNLETNTASWSDHIAGVVVKIEGALDPVEIGTPLINDTYIDIPISPGDLEISDGTFPIIEIYVYLNSTNLADNEILSFIVDIDHGFIADPNGSQFVANLAASILSNDFTIDVVATELTFISQPVNTGVNKPMTPDVTVSGTDINLNLDIDFDAAVTITSTGNLSPVSIQENAVAGIVTFSGITHTSLATGIQLTATSQGLTSAVSDPFDITILNEDFITCPPAGWLSVLISGNAWTCGSGYASVNGVGGTAPTEAWYITPVLDFSTLTNPALTFDTWTSGTDDSHPKLEVVYSTDYIGVGNPNQANWSNPPLPFNTPPENSMIWTPSGILDLSLLSSSNVYIAFRYTSSGTAADAATEWRIDNVAITEAACTAPSTPASNLVFSDIFTTEMTLTWDSGNGIGRIVVIKAGSAVAGAPSNGTNYNDGGSVFGSGATIAADEFVVYNGSGNSVTVTGLTQNTEYFFKVFEYNCTKVAPTFNATNPAEGSQSTIDPLASDIVENSGFSYPINIPYIDSRTPIETMTAANSVAVFGLTLRDGGENNDTDNLDTRLTSITFSTNGSAAIRSAALSYGSDLIEASKEGVNGMTEFTIDISDPADQIVAPDDGSVDFILHVTFREGAPIIDNEQIVFTVTGVTADVSGTQFAEPDGGGAETALTGDENRIEVTATALEFVQEPVSFVPVGSEFPIEVEAIDSQNTRDLDVVDVLISVGSGAGTLRSVSTPTNPVRTTENGTALWDDLIYETTASLPEFPVTFIVETTLDQGFTSIETSPPLTAKGALSIFTFTGGSPAPDNQPEHLTISDMRYGSSLTPDSFIDAFNAGGWSTSTGPEDEHYYEFTITADPGFEFTISSIEIDHRRTGDGPDFWEFRASSFNNYGSTINGVNGVIGLPAPNTWYRNRDIPFNATVPEVVDQQVVTIRLYGYGANSASGNLTIDNLAIFGSVTDFQPPAFTSGYPTHDSITTAGFDLIVNLDEPATVYYVIQPDGNTKPDVQEILAGQNGDGGTPAGSGNFVVSEALTDVRETIISLSSDALWDVFYVLDDGVNQSGRTEQPDVPTSDTNTDLVAAASQPGGTIIPSTADTQAESVDVFNFNIQDLGTQDGDSTTVTKLAFNKSGASDDLSTIIAGVQLYNNTTSAIVPLSNMSIGSNSIELDIASGDLNIENGTTAELTLAVWVQSTVVDNSTIQLEIGGADHVNTTSVYGSQFSSTLTTLTSSPFTIEVDATRLLITDHTEVYSDPETVTLDVLAVDENGNTDVDEISNVTVALEFNPSTGELTAFENPKALVAGAVSWNDIDHEETDIRYSLIVTSDAGLSSDVTSLITKGDPGENDLLVTDDLTLTRDLQGIRDVVIFDGATLTLNSGITMEVGRNLEINGTGNINDLGATIDFNGLASTYNSPQSIFSDQAGKTISLNNIDVSSEFTVTNNVNINLRNTLLINSGTFDIDGAANDQNFTLLSTSGSTARIGPMADGTSIDGQIIWQRSLRTGPPGFRYIGTPIKDQNLGSISDDVWIQGIAESFPGAYTNISTYFEPVGTEGMDGFEGWQDFSSNSDALNVGEGMKLYLWGVDYATEQVISQKGEPFIAGGDDGLAGNGESVTFNASYTESAYDGGGWNFFANPYPSEIDWNEVTYSAIDGEAVHVWNPVLKNYGTYSPSTGESTNGVSQYIASGQGFFIKAQNGSGSITFSESSKPSEDGNSNSFLREADELLTKLKVEINASDGSKDEAAIVFTDFATDGYDPQFDAKKLSAGWVNISSVLDNSNIVINAMGEKRGVQRIQLNIEPYVYGSFTMKFPAMEAFAEGATAKLVDHYLDKTKYINSSSSYVFDIDENNPDTYGPDRFEIQFVEPANFRFDQPDAKAGQEFIMPIFADKLEDVLDAYMTLSWDHEALTFVGIEDAGLGDISNFDLSEVENGRLIYTDEQQDPLSLPDGTQLFSIRFEARNGQPQAELRFEKANMRLKAIEDIDMPFSTEDVLINILQSRFVSGAISTYGGTSINEVLVKAQAMDETIENISDLSGVYQLGTYEQSNYTVSANKTDADPLSNAVTTLDIIQSRSHILGKEEFMNPYQWIAADVNGSQSITAIDLVEMRKVILGINTAFESGLNWLFIPDTYDLSNDPFGYQTSVDIALNEQDLDLNFVGVKVGDVDNSWTNEGGARKSNLDFALRMENMTLQDNLVEIPVVVDAYSDIRGYQFSVTWDPNELEYFGVSSDILEGFFNEQMVEQGILTTLWDDIDGEPRALQEGDVLMTLKFRARHETAASEVAINSTVTEAIAFDGNLNAMSIRSNPARVDLEQLRNGQLELFQNIPNPFDFSTTIDFRVPKPGLVRFSIVNTLGEIVYIHEDNYKAGIYSLDWDRSQGSQSIAPGVYLYRLESNGAEVVKKMMIK
jgi:hypothetical protein